MANGADWFSDGKISLPNPPPSDPLIDLGGFSFTAFGICHPITAAVVQDMSMPSQPPVQDG